MQLRARLRLMSLSFATLAVACTAELDSGGASSDDGEEDAGATSVDRGSGGQTGGNAAGGSVGGAAGASTQVSGGAGGDMTDAGMQSRDGGMATGGGGASVDARVSQGDVPAGWVPAIVGVGYAGVRIRSTDTGLTWKNLTQLAPSGGDDENLLRAVAYGKGLWATGGWKYLTSTDGITWKQQQQHPCGGGIVDGLAFGNGIFIATCGSNAYVSSDGLTWRRGGRFESGGHPKVVFGGGKFAAFGDAKQVFESKDGLAWTRWNGMTDAASCMDEIKSRASCGVPGNGAWGQGFWFRAFTPDLGGGGIFRSADGSKYSRVSQTNVEAFAFGFAPPSSS
ncbi:MAG: hypothetical protein SF187_08740 [Deltaproteobacteria bacterium]|nr:hypothetical protein [Deltaproteobacteria bacterium]